MKKKKLTQEEISDRYEKPLDDVEKKLHEVLEKISTYNGSKELLKMIVALLELIRDLRVAFEFEDGESIPIIPPKIANTGVLMFDDHKGLAIKLYKGVRDPMLKLRCDVSNIFGKTKIYTKICEKFCKKIDNLRLYLDENRPSLEIECYDGSAVEKFLENGITEEK